MLCIKLSPDIITLPEDRLTKRNVISAVARVYDPSGLMAPAIVSGKILQQEIWRSGIGWDEPIPARRVPK